MTDKDLGEVRYYAGKSRTKGRWYVRRAIFMKNTQRTCSEAQYLRSTNDDDKDFVMEELRELGYSDESVHWL